jgi:O-antigen ligase
MPGFWAELRSPLGPPLGYANANAALFVQAEVAALMLLVLSTRLWHRATAGMLAAVFALMPVLIGSVAGSILAAGVAGAAVLRRARWVPAACGLALALAFVATTAAGGLRATRGAPGTAASDSPAAGAPRSRSTTEAILHPPGPKQLTAVERAVEGNRRVVLWGEAFSIMAHRPLWGTGPGRFAETAPTALADPDAAWAHNGFLQQGAETGVPGLILVASLFAWALAQTEGVHRRAASGRRRAGASVQAMQAVGAAGVAALGMHATVDYVLHFPAVTVAGALLAGFAAGHVQLPAGSAADQVQSSDELVAGRARPHAEGRTRARPARGSRTGAP